ncbi:hypothetical protein PHISCL_03619 [Aspergillus sclerotialis]|uniref:Uncharacterized protein n=1 Tax=Aspergillus sclerotialis TaxID=2070753 RepID=A0A3A3A1K2_9EURO|nr:hypothetical protein PHISCL_03619 [Aspergillus sclerotialis]
MYIPLQPRLASDPGDGSGGQSDNKNHVFVICAATIICSLTFIAMTFFVLRTLRRMNCRPKYLPGKYLKEKWYQWPVGPRYGQVPEPAQSRDTAYHPPASGQAAETATEMNTANNANGIQRDTSIRSIITLPAYSQSPKPTEQIIAREGERAGMDVVVEFPETAEEEEARREETMESLYQIRLRRRQEVAERQARREARRAARAQGDEARVEQLRMESRRNRSSTNDSSRSASMLLREHRARSRESRISRVNYAALGCVRHDGSRVRANSAESDSHPLLDASRPSMHSRDDSIASLLSASSTSDVDTLHLVSSHPQSTRQSMSADDGDVGALNIPPPDYDHLDWGEAPAYTSPIAENSSERSQNLQLPEITPLPAIHVDVASPVNDSPATPTNPHPQNQSGQSEPSDPSGPSDSTHAQEHEPHEPHEQPRSTSAET